MATKIGSKTGRTRSSISHTHSLCVILDFCPFKAVKGSRALFLLTYCSDPILIF